MTPQIRSIVCAVLALGVVASAQESVVAEPEHKQAVYLHPVELLTMGGGLFIPKTKLVWIGLDVERFLASGWSAVAGIQYLGTKVSDNSDNSGEFTFFDLVAGGRWYPGKGFSGFYLQPQLDYNRMSMYTQSNKGETGDLRVSRFGLAAVGGYNLKSGRVSFDWNVGVCGFVPPDIEVERRYPDGRQSVLGLDEALSEGAVSSYKSGVKFIAASFMPTMNLGVGVQF